MFAVFPDKQVIPYVRLRPSSQAGCVNCILPDGSVASCQPDGTLQTRPSEADGSYEQAQQTGSVVAYAPNGKSAPMFVFAAVNVASLQA